MPELKTITKEVTVQMGFSKQGKEARETTLWTNDRESVKLFSLGTRKLVKTRHSRRLMLVMVADLYLHVRRIVCRMGEELSEGT